MYTDKWKNKSKSVEVKRFQEERKPKERKRNERRSKSRVDRILRNIDVQNLESAEFDDGYDLELDD